MAEIIEARQIVDQDFVKQFRNCDYMIVTIVPYADKPELRIYQVSREELGDFSNMLETAEFVISVIPWGTIEVLEPFLKKYLAEISPVVGRA